MTRYLLDTDALIAYFNGIAPALELVRDLHLQGDVLCICSMVMAEMHSGFSPSQRQQGDALLGAMRFLASSPEIGRQAGEWRYDFARQGVQLATTDCVIAATAYLHQATLITGNAKHLPMPELSRLTLRR